MVPAWCSVDSLASGFGVIVQLHGYGYVTGMLRLDRLPARSAWYFPSLQRNTDFQVMCASVLKILKEHRTLLSVKNVASV